MDMDTSGNNDIFVDCSDDEDYNMKFKDGYWLPPPEDVIRLFEEINEKGYVELEWQCPGRRPPTPSEVNYSIASNNSDENMDVEYVELKRHVDKSDFDFKDEMSHLDLAVRPAGDYAPRGSAKKKTTTFDAVLSNFVRHLKQNLITDDDIPNQ